jgi:serine/threonine-protein kinase RsbW
MTDPTAPSMPQPADKPVRRASFMFEATLEDVSRVAQALRFFIPPEVSEEAKSEMEIGVVEAMTNIVKHGYGSSEHGVIEVNYSLSAGVITIELRDQGKPISSDMLFGGDDAVFDFDPDDIDSLPESGMGMSLMRNTFDQIDYDSANGSNLLRMVKHVQAPPGNK